MPFKIGEAYIEIVAKSDKLSAELVAAKNRVKSAVMGFKAGFGSIKSSISGAVGALVNFRTILGSMAAGYVATRMFSSMIREAEDYEMTLARLEQTLKSTGYSAGFTAKQLTQLASKLESVTTFSDTAVMAGMNILATFKNIREDAFIRTTEVALDMSRVMGQDLRSTIVQLGKALNDPISNLGALGRAGVQFSETQKEMIKSLVKNNELFKAQAIILKELESEFGGAARAEAETFGGAMAQLKNYFGDLLREMGMNITKSRAWIGMIQEAKRVISGWIDKLKELREAGKLESWVRSMGTLVLNTLKQIGTAAGLVGKTFLGWQEIFSGLELVWGKIKQTAISNAEVSKKAWEDAIKAGASKEVIDERYREYQHWLNTAAEGYEIEYKTQEQLSGQVDIQKKLNRLVEEYRSGWDYVSDSISENTKVLYQYYDDFAGVMSYVRKKVKSTLADLPTGKLQAFMKSLQGEISILGEAPKAPSYFGEDYEKMLEKEYEEERLTMRLRAQLAGLTGDKEQQINITKQLYDLELNRLLETRDLTSEQEELVKKLADQRKKMLEEGRKPIVVQIDTSQLDTANVKLEKYTTQIKEVPKDLELKVKTGAVDDAISRLNDLSSKMDEINSKSINIKMTGEASPRLPLMQTLGNVMGKFSDFSSMVTDNIGFNLDFGDFSSAVSAIKDLYRMTNQAAIAYYSQRWYPNISGEAQTSMQEARQVYYGFLNLLTKAIEAPLSATSTGRSPIGSVSGGFQISPGAFQINVYSDTENLVELAEKVEDAIASNIRTGRSKIFEALAEVSS